ncbi:coronin-like protein crn1 [Terfezia claveryi]|nr:coronin-like protein crn1 [Terfezia claveryi]
MAGRFVRASKYRHVFGRSTKKELCYDNLHISRNAWDSNIIKANPTYLAVNWESGGGGAFAVIPLSEKGRAPEQIPLFRGHTAPVLDTDWSPFNDSIIASGSDDGKVFIWQVPENFTLQCDGEPQDVAPVHRLAGHARKVGHVLWHPVSENVLATNSGDFTIKLWDAETGDPKLTLKHKELVQSMSFSGNGSMMVTTCRDKRLRIWDLRQEKAVHEAAGHQGAKNSRAVWMGDLDRIATTGFTRTSDRQLGLWDIHKPTEPIGGFQTLDSISGVCMPFWDDGTKCLYLAGRGDGNIRYFEYANDDFLILSEYKSADAQRGIAFLPKRGVALHENEVMRAFKTVNDTYIEPISFVVPRRAETFQNDIYPPRPWFEGKDASVPLFDLEQLYSPEGVTVDVSMAKTFAPVATAAPAPVSKPAAPVESKVAASAESPVRPPSPAKKDPAPQAFEIPALKKVTRPQSPVKPESPKAEKPVVNTNTDSPASPVHVQETPDISVLATIPEQLVRITALLETQNKLLASQTDQIGTLTTEVDQLKMQISGEQSEGAKKDEIIRKLELELEQARS